MRVKTVWKDKKLVFCIATAAVVVCIAAAICFLTDQLRPVSVLSRLSRVDWNEIRARNLTVEGDKDWTDIVCLGKIPEKNITLYGYNDQECFGQGVAVEIGEDRYYFDWVYITPRMLLPDCYWKENDGQLQISLNVYTGTGVSAQELHVLRYRDGELTDSAFAFQEYSEILTQRIQSAYDSAACRLTLTDRKTGKELCTVKLGGEKEIVGIETGMISEFILGDTVSLQVKPGCRYENEAAADYGDDIPLLRAEVILSEDSGEPVFDLGDFSVLP